MIKKKNVLTELCRGQKVLKLIMLYGSISRKKEKNAFFPSDSIEFDIQIFLF